MTKDEVKAFGDLRKVSTWEAALASKKVVSNVVDDEVSNPVIEPVSEAITEQGFCAVEANHTWYTLDISNDGSEQIDRRVIESIYKRQLILRDGEQWLSCDLPETVDDSVTQDDSKTGASTPTDSQPTTLPPNLPKPAPTLEPITVSHAEPVIMLITLLLVIAHQLITTLTPVIRHITTEVKQRRATNRRRNQWYNELRQLMTNV